MKQKMNKMIVEALGILDELIPPTDDTQKVYDLLNKLQDEVLNMPVTPGKLAVYLLDIGIDVSKVVKETIEVVSQKEAIVNTGQELSEWLDGQLTENEDKKVRSFTKQDLLNAVTNELERGDYE